MTITLPTFADIYRNSGATTDPSKADLAQALQHLAPRRRNLDRIEHEIITLARNTGMSWREIAAGLGLDSPQAAQQRYQRLGGKA